MEEETKKNQSTKGVQLHDIIVLEKHAGTKKHTWRSFEKLGVVIQLSEKGLTIKEPDGETYEYDASEEQDEDGYYHTISDASDVEYHDQIRKAINAQEKTVDDAIDKLEDLERWEVDFEATISFVGKLKRFIKGFNI